MKNITPSTTLLSDNRPGERGAALATAIMMLALLSAITVSVMAVVNTETKIAGSDLKRTQAFYAAASGIEKMTSDFSALFSRTSRPRRSQLDAIQAASPSELAAEGYILVQTIDEDTATLTAMRATQNITNGAYPSVTIPSGPFVGLTASVTPYILNTTAKSSSAEVNLTRQMNNYLIPLFQFGMFSDEDIELHPGPAFVFNGRVHANGNIYVNGNVKFLDKVTAANEFIYDVLRNGSTRTGATVSMKVGSINVSITKGSMNNGPNIVGAQPGNRGYFPGSPNGTINSSWNSTSVAAATSGVPNQFGGQLLTKTTGASALLLPLQLDGNPTRDIVKRRMPNDGATLSDSRYHTKAEIRILIDDEGVTSDVSGIPSTEGVNLSSFDPMPLPNAQISSGGGRALWRIPDTGGNNYLDTASTCVLQRQGGSPGQAMTVRGVKSTTQSVTLQGTDTKIPAGAGITGHIMIQIVKDDGTTYDVTREILSMGMTEGEPNAIVTLQRPLWAAFVQGSRDASGLVNVALNGDPSYSNSLTDIVNKTHIGGAGEIKSSAGVAPTQNTTYGYLTNVIDDTAVLARNERLDNPSTLNINDWGVNTCGILSNKDCFAFNNNWNAIVPINVYNVREGMVNADMTANAVYERGITNVIEINMRNLSRWLDGTFDGNLLAGTDAVSTNIGYPDGFIVYVSDRRGDKVKSMVDSSGATVSSTNGMVDNEDIYGANGLLDPGEDVQYTGALIKDTTELPDPANLAGTSGADWTARNKRALAVAAWTNPSNYFRRAVRLFDGEDILPGGPANRLSNSLGITMSAENMVYIWGNYNTRGINAAPASGTASVNDSSQASYYNGDQVPSSIVCDAVFALSRTWFDTNPSIYPDDKTKRPADNNLGAVTQETSVRAGIIAGNNRSALSGTPDQGNDADSRLSGGMHNFPRFLEDWLTDNRRWNFVGSFIPLFRSTQALGPWWHVIPHAVYYAPIRNWAFDTTFKDPNKLPPGTPLFQYIEPTAFRQIL